MYEFTITVTHMDVAITLIAAVAFGTVTLALALLSVLRSGRNVTPEDADALKHRSWNVIETGKTHRELMRHRMKRRWPE